MINEYLTGKAELGDNVVHILFSQNRWEKNEEMRRDLHNGITLIVDRYAYSGTAFTAAKEGFDLEECKRVDSGLPRPDAVFFLNIDEEVAKLRGGYGEERYETEWFQKRVRHNFQCLRSEEWKVVDGGQPCDVVERQLEELALSSIEQAKTSPLHDLWPELKLKPEQYNNIDL